VELNFEKHPQLVTLFSSNDPVQILLNLSASLNVPINPATSLVFLDEIQAAPELLAKMRWFAEEMPELPLIAAGSLLEFVLEQHSFSMPVGRINYMHLEPLSFEEFLLANNKQTLVSYLSSYDINTPIPLALHEQLISLFKEYLIIGGMPAAVANWSKNKSLLDVNQLHFDLLATYRDDFAKYRGRIAIERLDEVMMAVPKHLGEKFIYTSVNPSVQTPSIKQALDLLCKAKICNRVVSCAANGVPLAAEVREKFFKVIFLDVGLCSAALGANHPGLAQQFVGQALRTLFPPFVEPLLYYWQREVKGSEANVDYILSFDNKVIPLEVKAGSTGTFKSLHLFMGMKKYPLALKVNSDFPSAVDVNVKDSLGNSIQYKLLSLPFYLLGQLDRLI